MVGFISEIYKTLQNLKKSVQEFSFSKNLIEKTQET